MTAVESLEKILDRLAMREAVLSALLVNLQASAHLAQTKWHETYYERFIDLSLKVVDIHVGKPPLTMFFEANKQHPRLL